MPMEWSPESQFVKIQRLWNTPKRQGGMNRDGYEEYPRMLYKAQLNPISNRMEVNLTRDVMSADRKDVLLSAENFNNSCQMTVNSDAEVEKYARDGWRKSQAEAMQFVRDLEAFVAEAAANRNYTDRNASDAAKREIAAAEASTHKNLAEIPEAPRLKRKYTRKIKPEAAA